MMRLIDADILLGYVSKYDTGQPIGKALRAMLEKSPTVDAVTVIRCKDCKYYEETDETIGTCLLTESGAHIKGYCSWAEVREE